MNVLIDHDSNVNARKTLRGTTPIMWAADEGHAAAIQFLIEHGADIKAQSDLVERGRGPALGKANDPRRQVAAQGAALAAGNALDLPAIRAAAEAANTVQGAAAAGQRGAAAGQRGGGGRGGRGAAAGDGAGAQDGGDQNDDAFVAAFGRRGQQEPNDGGQLTALIYATRSNDLETVKVLLAAGVDVNQASGYGWSPLLVATQNRYYKLGAYLLEHGADPNL